MSEFISIEKLQELLDYFLLKAFEVVPSMLAGIIVLYIGYRLFVAGLLKLEDQTVRVTRGRAAEDANEAEKRIRTLYGVFRRTLFLIFSGLAILVSLRTMGVEVGPILAAAGVLGLAVSFGAQNLVRDVIGGIFILFENQIRVGDVAVINGTGGLVESINVRTVVLRDLEGVVHIFPNGTIDRLSNRTKDWSACVLDIGVAYKEDPDQVMQVLRDVAAEMREDSTFGPKIIADLEIFGVDDFGDSAVVIKVRFKTRPIEQWAVAREFRRRVKKAFDAAGIEIPFPHRTLYFGEASKPFEHLVTQAQPRPDGQ